MVHLQGIPQQASWSWPGATLEGRKSTAFSHMCLLNLSLSLCVSQPLGCWDFKGLHDF